MVLLKQREFLKHAFVLFFVIFVSLTIIWTGSVTVGYMGVTIHKFLGFVFRGFALILSVLLCMGGDLGGLRQAVPQNLRWGTAHASVSSIFKEVVLRDAREKYEVTEKR